MPKDTDAAGRDRTCQVCREPFKSKKKTQKTCSQACGIFLRTIRAWEYRNCRVCDTPFPARKSSNIRKCEQHRERRDGETRRERSCPACQGMFWSYDGKYKDGNCCSRQCKALLSIMKTHEWRVCEECCGLFYRRKLDKHRYCSHSCYMASRKARVERVCDWCRTVLSKSPSRYYSKHGLAFCGEACWRPFQIMQNTKYWEEAAKRQARKQSWNRFHKSNPGRSAEYSRAYREKDPERYRQMSRARSHARRARMHDNGPVDKIYSSVVFERDQHRCRICKCHTSDDHRPGHPRKSVLGHIVALAAGGTHTYDNVCCLCWECNARDGVNRLPIQKSLLEEMTA